MQHTLVLAPAKEVSIPSLSNHKTLRYFNFMALYFAQGIPEGMLTFGIPAWMAMNGKTPGEIAAFGIVSILPWSFKFIVAPLMDRYTFLAMGRKRPWVLTGQMGLVISCIYMACIPDPLNNLSQLMTAGFMIGFFGAFQDVATDGMAIDVIPAHQQARANGLMWGSKVAGMSISLAAGSWLLNSYGFSTAILMLAIVIGIIMLAPICLTERPGEKILPWSAGNASPDAKKLQQDNWRSIIKSLFAVFSLRNSLIIALLLFISQGGFKYMGALLPVFTVKELGWTNVEYSQYYAAAKLAGGILGMVFGGILIERFGKKRMMNIYFFAIIVTTAGLAVLQNYWSGKTIINAYMLVYNTVYTFFCIGVFAIAMQCCWKKVSASQFTLYMTIANLGQIVFAALIAPVKARFNWQITLLGFAVILAVAWLLFQYLNVDKQMEKVAALEVKDKEE